MARDRKCILCETVHVSKQEMEEHIRSMLHHRELEKLKGRDCGHECRVCKVTVVGLTDYASHISSPSHKQKVEAADQKQAGNGRDEDYFDQTLVELIENRKEQIRKEKEAAAQLAKEEEEQRRQEAFEQRLLEAKEQYRREHGWQQPSHRFGASGNRSNWYKGNRGNCRQGEWQHGNQGRSSTWHAQEPPNFHRWASEEFTAGRNQEHRGNRTWGQGSPPQNPQSRLPWLSSGGSSNGLYGRNNISQFGPRGPSQNFSGSSSRCPPLPTFLTQALNHFKNGGNDQRAQQGAKSPSSEGQSMETDHNGCKSSKAFGSNPKVDKTCRWSPYPVTKGPDGGPCHDATQNPTEKHPKVSKPRDPEPSGSNRRSRPEQKAAKPNSSRQSVEDIRKPKDRSSSSNTSSSSQKDVTVVTPSPGQKANKPSPPTERKISSVPDLSSGAKLSQAQANPIKKHSGIKSAACGPQKQPSSERQLLKTLKKARQLMMEKKGSLDSPNRMETDQEEQRMDQSHVGVNKENSCVQNAAKQTSSDSGGPEKRAAPSSLSSQNLQSLQVSTSMAETSEPAASARDGELSWKRPEKQLGPATPDEAMQVGEAGPGAEGDASKSTEAPAAPGLSRLDLPPVLKRDLTKHISSKSKAIGHEPNLNIARRVRNLSESRRSDSEKDSGIKPTVRQLISSSGSRRNVNWEQVYQEVRKKQDKGKGMPRFGIEMVPCEQEYHSQEEDDIPLLEGFHWESLMDVSSQSTSRKRSLSESSITPASSHALFPPPSKETSEREELCAELQTSAASSDHKPAEGHEEGPPEAARLLGQSVVQAPRQPEKLLSSSVRALQRSDSVLGDSSSGAEQHDGQGTGKRRRATVDLTSPEASCLEHDSKRRKVKSKKERLQIDQLLAVSLREDELSRSLQTVDTNLVQARAALEAAYVEVQRLMVVKQQMTGEMSTLRNKRIELLRGMQNEEEETPPVKLKEEKRDSVEAEASVRLPTAALSPSRAAQCASPPSSSLPSTFRPVVIKQEPQSPVYISSEPNLAEDVHCAHSTTPELPAAPPAAPDPAFSFEPSPESRLEAGCGDVGEPTDCKEALRDLIETTEKATQAGNSGLQSDTKSSIKLLPPGRRDSGTADCGDALLFQPPAPPLNLPASPSDLRGGKRVRKLKKRKALKKAQGAEQPETSDTEGDEEASRPRWLRSRRRPSGGSQVSTSSLPTEEGEGTPKPPRQLFVAIKLEKIDLKKLKMESYRADPVTNQDREESMEVTASLEQPVEPPLPDSARTEPPTLACNVVSSTSDMDLCRSSESELPFAITYPKNSSDASSDHGEDDLPSEGAFEGHQEAVNSMQIHNGQLYTCSGDRTVKVFDLVSRKCVGVFEGHSSKVSCLLLSAAPSLHHRLYSGSSDQTIRCYNLKTREFEQQFSLSDRVLCLHSRWRTLFAGLANGTVVTFNLKTNKQMDVFECHGPRGVSCLASSQEGARRILLVGSYDNTISVRDAKNGLLLRLLEGHTKTVLCMKVVNDLVFSGSSDQCVHAHNIHTGELVRVYKGHSHGVTVVSILGKVMVTACLDKLIRVYDLQSHEQLQVYGGHKDMVMCMAVHKNMIYSGCYDGSVQAVKLNLMQSSRCWWHGCSMVFGVADHLQQHLLNDHASAPLLKCRWKNCEEFFGSRNSSKQGMLLHMQKHAAEETEVEP